ncbi:putative serine threonine protein kinase protein [Botrytis cinerea BcDW1]|uniref:Putative serine threonine protein kinase protein n=1 Tax=Botryotinia fuckeliana (strain BcDW1) TaxID=1290391 RepID=M7TMC5_BOTF1|nr:putative serine threonine protein kinase protein [Botrytis cinerea BcDW1]
MANTNAADLFYRSQVPPTAAQNPGSKIFASMFDKYMVAPSSKDDSAYLVFPVSYTAKLRDDEGEEIDGSLEDSEDCSGIQWAAGVYEHLRGNHPKLLEFKGRDSYGYLLSKSSIGPLTFALHSHPTFATNPLSLAIIYRWAFNTLSALQYLHSRDVVHHEFCSETLWLEPDLSLSMLGLWGAHVGHYCPNTGNQMTDIRLEERFVSFQTDLFDWASWVYGLVTGKGALAVLEGFEGGPNEMEEERRRRVAAKQFPVLGEEMLGAVVGKCWRSEYTSSMEAVDELKAFLEQMGFQCEENGDLVDFDNAPYEYLKVFNNPYLKLDA